MTSIACWFNEETNGAIWVVGDSKITRGANDQSMLLDSGAKIFAIPLICKTIGNNGFFDRTFLETKVGLAYAGSSLIGLNIQAALTTIFSNLNGLGRPPSLEALGEYARMIAKSYIDTLAEINPKGALCEISLMGYCYVTHIYRICHIKPEFSSGCFEMVMSIYDSQSSEEDFILMLGDKKSEIEQQIISLRNSCEEKNIRWHRAPQMILKELIKNDTYGTIGGYLQQGYCLGANFNLVSTCMPVEGQEPKAYLSYLGFDITGDASRVGDCFVGINGMV